MLSSKQASIDKQKTYHPLGIAREPSDPASQLKQHSQPSYVLCKHSKPSTQESQLGQRASQYSQNKKQTSIARIASHPS